MGSNLFYFQHKAGARNDISIRRLDLKFGKRLGYAMFFQTLEVMLESANGTIAQHEIDDIALILDIETDVYYSFMSECVKLGLFQIVNAHYQSENFLEWKAGVAEIREKRRLAGVASGEKRRLAAEASHETAEQPEPDIDIKIEKTPKPAVPYEQIIDCWNSLAVSMKCQKLTADLRKAIEKRVKDYGLEVVLATVKNYHDAKNAPNTFFEYGWNMTDFFNRKNAFPAFVGDHDAIVKRYQKGQKPQIAPEPERRGGMYTQQETDPASDNHYRSHPEMTDPRIGKKWGEMSKEEIDNMIKSRRYDENGKRIANGQTHNP
jgi:hypothetical protein